MTLACIEPHFFKIFIEKFLEALPEHFVLSEEWREFSAVVARADRKSWPKLKQFLMSGFSLRTRNDWADIFFGGTH